MNIFDLPNEVQPLDDHIRIFKLYKGIDESKARSIEARKQNRLYMWRTDEELSNLFKVSLNFPRIKQDQADAIKDEMILRGLKTDGIVPSW